jgi:hypothetical protein
VDPLDFVRDIVQITALISEDGDEYSFIHKSVQEFHAAMWVKEQPDAFVERFYEGMLRCWEDWQEELAFLKELDGYRFEKYFGIQYRQQLLGVDGTGGTWKCRKKAFLRILGKDALILHHSTGLIEWRHRTGHLRCCVPAIEPFEFQNKMLATKREVCRVFDAIGEEAGLPEVREAILDQRGVNQCDVADLVDATALWPKLSAYCESRMQSVLEDLKGAMAMVTAVERRPDDFLFAG